MIVHPSVRKPLLVLGGLSLFVGALALAAGLSSGPTLPLVWRGAVALAIGLVALALARQARPDAGPPER